MDPLTWGGLWANLSYIATVVMGATAILLWIYRELNSLRSKISDVQLMIAQQYFSLESARMLEERIELALAKLGDRLDKTIERLYDTDKLKRNNSV